MAQYGVGTASEARAAQATALANDPEVKTQPTKSEAMKGNQNARKEKSDRNTVTVVSHGRGNAQEYLVRRLKRDAPEIAAALGRGEFRAARAAAIAAGILKEATPVERLLRAWARASGADRREFLGRVGAPIREEGVPQHSENHD